MKTIQLSIPREEASRILKESLREISSSAIRAFSKLDCYGNVDMGENETTFTVGLGPTGFTTANGKIAAMGPDSCEVIFCFKGPFWSYLKRDLIKTHIIKTFKPYMLNH